MTQKNQFPTVLEPQTVIEVSTLCYQSMYEGSEESKKRLETIDSHYFSSDSTKDNEKAYMMTFMSTAHHLAKKMKEIETRKQVREQRTKENKENCIMDAYNMRKSDLKKAEEIRDNNLAKNEKIRDEELGSIKDKQSVWNKVVEVAPASVSSLLIGLNYLPPLAASGVAGIVTVATYTVSKFYHSKNRSKKEDVLTDYYDENAIVLYNYREQQQITESVYAKKRREINKKCNDELTKIEQDTDSRRKRHFIIGESKLIKAYERHFGIKLSDGPSALTFDKLEKHDESKNVETKNINFSLRGLVDIEDAYE